MRISEKTHQRLLGYGGNPRQIKFRKHYRVGAIVSGYILEYTEKKIALVRIEDMTLIASIRPGYPEGKILSFQVITLYPEIQLQELDTDGYQGLNLLV